MKAHILSLLLLGYSFIGFAQQQDNSIAIGIVLPDQQEEINAKSFKLLETKLKSVAARNGIFSDSYGSFVMYPQINIIDNALVEGGLKNINIVEIEMTLFVKQFDTNVGFGSCSKTLKGSGNTISDAVKNAFSKISPNDNTYAYFFTDVKDKIKQYYRENKEKMIKSARTMAAQQQYEQAFALLMTYPSSMEGSDEVQDVAIEIYKKYQDATCSAKIAQARGSISTQDYEAAIDILATVDSESACHEESLKLIEQIGAEIRDEQKRELEMQNKLIDNAMTLESKRIDAIREIGVEYAKNHQPRITYTQIIK